MNTTPDIFLCSVCKNEFSNWWNLRKHIYIHLPKSDKRFKCSVCSYTTTQKFTAKRHLQKIHNNLGEVIESKLSIQTLEEHKRIYTESQKYTRQQRFLQNPKQKLPPTPQIIVIEPQILKTAHNDEAVKSIMKPKIIIRPLPEKQNEYEKYDNDEDEDSYYEQEITNYEEKTKQQNMPLSNANHQYTYIETLEQLEAQQKQQQNTTEYFDALPTTGYYNNVINSFYVNATQNKQLQQLQQQQQQQLEKVQEELKTINDDDINITEATVHINELQCHEKYDYELLEVVLSQSHINDLIEFNEAEDEDTTIMSLPISNQSMQYNTMKSQVQQTPITTYYQQQQSITTDPVLGNSYFILNDDDDEQKINDYLLTAHENDRLLYEEQFLDDNKHIEYINNKSS